VDKRNKKQKIINIQTQMRYGDAMLY